LYLLCELDNTLRTFERAADGSITEIDSVDTLPAAWDGASYTAEVRVHPSGSVMFASNRGHDSIVSFELDDDGLPAVVGHVDSGGEWPRHFNITPDGEQLIAANQFTDDLTPFEIDTESGTLERVGEQTSISKPVCVTFAE